MKVDGCNNRVGSCWVVKKTFIITLIIGLIISASGCETKVENDKDSSSTAKLTDQKIYQLPIEKTKEQYTIEDFKSLYTEYLKLNNIHLNSSPENDKTEMSKEDRLKYYIISDITPENVKKEIGCQIFKVNYTCESYVIHKGELFRIGFGFGGYGVVTLTTCDFEEDGQKDLIYTFSWGSGLHRSHIGIFDFSGKKEIWLDFVQLNEDITLEKLSDNSFNVYTADLEMKEELNFTKPIIAQKEIVAKVGAKSAVVEVIP